MFEPSTRFMHDQGNTCDIEDRATDDIDMTCGADVIHTAEHLVRERGCFAARAAADQFLECQKTGDNDGMARWVEIMLAIRELNGGR